MSNIFTIAVTEALTDLEGNEIKEAVGTDEDGKPILRTMTVRSALCGALMNVYEGVSPLSAETHVSRLLLAQRIMSLDAVPLSAGEITVLKGLIVLMGEKMKTSPLIIGKVLLRLDPPMQPAT